jgi:RHS repeat-associated protein
LPTEDGSGDAVPIGLYRNGKFFAVHSDHLNTPRKITDETNKLVWQWPYSAFGDNKPTGILKATVNPNNAYTQDPTTNARLQATNPAITFNLRHPGQYFDFETGLFYNTFRTYNSAQGRYTQNDPIGLGGGLNRFGYVDGSPLMFTDPLGLQSMPGGVFPRGITPNLNPQNRLPPGAPAPVVNQVVGGATDFMRNYNDMRTANTIGADKYFHCKANCQASRRGPVGDSVACKISDGREWFDQAIKGDPASASEADQAANTFGRSHAGTPGSCDVVCGPYRPNALSSRY